MRFAALTLALALAAAPAAAQVETTGAYDRGEGLGFGVTPWLHLGPSWVTVGEADASEPLRHGLTFEATLQALLVYQRVVLGLIAGYFGSGGGTEAGGSVVKLAGLQVLPVVMVSLFERLSLYAKGGYLFLGAVNDVDVTVGAARAGGGVIVILHRGAATDIALSADVTRTWLVSADAGAPIAQLGIISAQVGLSFTIDPAVLD